jgi:cytochrome c5
VLEEFELLTSTDERFRPVNMFGGPEDAIYVVDMNRGLFQHKLFLTSYLRKYSEKMGLDKAGSTGRIWKISKTTATQKNTVVSPGDATPAQLVELLSHPNKWYRDTAQRLLVDGEDLSAVTIAALRNSNSIHAARTLEAHGRLKAESVLVFLESDNQQQQILGLQLMASVAAENNSQIHRAAQRIHDAGGLSAWQNTLTGGSGTATAKPAPSAPDVFMQTCASCHNTDAQGIDKLAPSLVGTAFLNGNDDILHKIITDGYKTMPPITTLNQDQRQEIIDYLRTL